MALPKEIRVKETVKELRGLIKKSKALFRPRLRMLIEIKKNNGPLSKIALADKVGANPNSIQTWRKNYEKGGLETMLSHKMNASRPSVFSKEEHDAMDAKLKDPENGLCGYKELQEWLEGEFGTKHKYNTLFKYCVANFGTKIKVARKSHVNKDGEKVLALKKTLAVSAGK